jgi:hypothetical protein
MPPCSPELVRPRRQKKQSPSEKRKDAHPIAHLQVPDVRPDGLHHAHELVPEPGPGVGPQGVASLPDRGLGRPVDADVLEPVVGRRPHLAPMWISHD